MSVDSNAADKPLPALRVLLVDEDPARAKIVEESLVEAGCRIAAVARPEDDLVERVKASAPDVIIVDMDSPSRDTLESLRAISREVPRPIVMFVDTSDTKMIEEAISAGVSAYVVDGLSSRRVKPVLDVAIARFKEFQALRQELEKTKTSLKERRVIERAKGLLMDEKRMSEEDAYRTLRKLAMDQNKRLVDVAEALITYAQLLHKR
ncbi:MAG: ANTAR domain-containing protein [Proteobacteria bacterium]|nr:ANTAR domain-containing protein [Pseudomonadota bacterium]MBI3500149.1 ANTAR domain-containing protein [Pseudomonadota bacterium]